MEWNAKSIPHWDWEHLFFYNSKAAENTRFLSTDWNAEGDREINAGLFYLSGSSGCSGSELIHTSSRSSKSVSFNSSSNGDSKTSMFTLEGAQDDSSGNKGLSKEDPVETSPVPEPFSASGELLLTLKLGKRLYFEDVCAGSELNNSSSGIPISASSTGKKFKSNNQHLQHPHCQVEGCGLDLSSAKDYHRKHRVCENHSKSPKVVIAGLERRFCQQCSRFHGLSEFDDKKRSCRRRLSDHNARRRKPVPEAVHLNSSPYDGRQLNNQFAYSRTVRNLALQGIHSCKLPQTQDFLVMPGKAFSMEDSMISSDPNAAQDLNRALSLLSTNSWGAYETKSNSLVHSSRTTSATPSMTHAMAQRFPFASSVSENWHPDQQASHSSICISYSDCDNSSSIQGFQLLRAPYESGFSCIQLD